MKSIAPHFMYGIQDEKAAQRLFGGCVRRVECDDNNLTSILTTLVTECNPTSRRALEKSKLHEESSSSMRCNADTPTACLYMAARKIYFRHRDFDTHGAIVRTRGGLPATVACGRDNGK